jgi:hypothetical protein
MVTTFVVAAMTAASVAFMAHTLYTARQTGHVMELAEAAPFFLMAAETGETGFPVLDEPFAITPGDAYMLGLHGGFVTVFFGADGAQGIKEVTSTPVGALPREEWARLAVGIPVSDDEELSFFLQDYGS